MRAGSGLDKFASVVLVLCVGIVVSGTKACQTDYEVGVQSKVPTGTATGTPTGDGTSAVTGTVTGTPTGETTGTAAATATTVATATGAATATADPSITSNPSITEEEASGGDDLFNELSKLDGDSRLSGKAPAVIAGGSGGVIQPENWLGDAFSKDEEEDGGSWQDSDGDGFSDSLEEEFGTDPNGAGSAPLSALVTRLAARVGSEAVGDEAPRESGDVTDTDNDGVSDETEEQRGMNPRSMDSDVDGLPDNKELAFGCNPLHIDSDGDGISDGREFDFGADPTIAEPKRGGN